MLQNVYPCDKLSGRRHAVTSHTHSARVFYYNHEMSEEEISGPMSIENKVDETSKADVLSRKATLRRSINCRDYSTSIEYIVAYFKMLFYNSRG
jgi:hypothetical protein